MKSTGDIVELEEVKQILDKLEKVNGQKSTKDIIKIIFVIALSVISVIISGFICFVIYKNGLTTESVLSILLAFFSIYLYLSSFILKLTRQVINFMTVLIIL